ncbi:MAG: hypothetical protein Q9220_004672 [cf. Caloplaca sp. 1 TL-2023]
MWNRILGNDPSTSTPERRNKNESQRSTPRRFDTAKSTRTATEDNDRGFNPTSTSYSSTTRNKYPGTASASIASSYATASSNPNNDPYFPPGLIRNASLADQVPTSFGGDDRRTAALDSSSKSEARREEATTMDSKRQRKDRRGTRDNEEDSRSSKGDRSKKSRKDSKGGTERAMSVDKASYASSQRVDQVATTAGSNGNSSFAPTTDPYNPTRPDSTHGLPQSQSSHVQDQFPGQFPSQSAAPYRPPQAVSEGGPGLAAEYYGDAGQSVAHQPGFRVHSPSLIIGAEPHLQAASAVAAPPPEPSATGGVGAAASFFDPNFSAGSDVDHPQSNKPTSITGSSISQYTSAAPASSTFATSSTRPPTQQASSAPLIPTLGAAALGAAAIHHMSDRPSKPGRPEHEAASSSSVSAYGRISGSASHQQSSEAYTSYPAHSSSSRPPNKPGKHSSHSSNIPLYAAGAVGLAAAAHHHNHHNPSQHSAHGQQQIGATMAQQQRHRHHGPLSKFVDFFKDPDGVAQFEEYTEYIGVCRHCFAPGSSSRDAPRKHHYHRRRSNERFGSSVRVDKDSRYWSSENESRRRKNKSWLEAGIAGYGLAKVGESLFKQDNESDDSRKARKSHHRRRSSSSDRKSYTSRGVIHRSSDSLSHRKRSEDRFQTGITSDGKLYRKDSHGNVDTSSVTTHRARHRSRSRSNSRDRKHSGSNAVFSAAIGSSIIASSASHRSRSPRKEFIRSRHGDEKTSTELASVLRLDDPEPREHRRRSSHSSESKHRKRTKKQKKSRGFFTFSNSSSSSASSNMAFGADIHHKATKSARSKKDTKRSRDADAAILGLGAAAAALALSQNQRSKHKGELVAVKEAKGKHKSGKVEHKGKKGSSTSSEDLWESASEGGWSSADSELAYGTSLHRRSEESLSSDAAGLDKWSWRWGSKKPAKKAPNQQRYPSGDGRFEPANATRIDPAQPPLETLEQKSRMTSTSSIPMQHVYPMPTSDPTQFDVGGHDTGFPSFQSQHFSNGRPDPVPIQHPQPIASVSPSVYTTQAPYAHSYSAPTGPSSYPQSSSIEQRPGHIPESFPTGNEYFEPFMRDSKNDRKSRRRDSSPVMHKSEFEDLSAKPQRRKSLKDDSSSVRFDLTKEQEDKDRRDARRRRKEDEKRRERLERQESEERKDRERERETRPRRNVPVGEPMISSPHDSRDTPHTVTKQSWAAPAAAGVIATAIGATVAAKSSSHDERTGPEDRDVEVIIKERHASSDVTVPDDSSEHGQKSKRDGMSVWQAAAKLQKSSSHTEYAAYFTPPELLSKSSDVKEIVGANADNDITVYQVPNMITVEPSDPGTHSPSRAYSFPITADDMQHSEKALPWSVPKLNLVEPTPPTSRAGSVIGNRSPHSPSPLSNEVQVSIPLEPLESLGESDGQHTGAEHAEYTVIEPKGRSVDFAESPVSNVNTNEAVPGISSLKNRTGRKKPPPAADYGDDLDFAATVAAGLQDTGFNPSIVIDDPSFRRRDSPPGSEGERSAKDQFIPLTEAAPEDIRASSPPHGFVEELPDQHVPGSFEDVDEHPGQSRSPDRETRSSRSLNNRGPEAEELTSPKDNNGVKPRVYTVEKEASEIGDSRNAAIDPVGNDLYTDRRSDVRHKATEPSDNSFVSPNVYSAEPESPGSRDSHSVTVDPGTQRSQTDSKADDRTPSTARADETIDSSPDVIEYLSEENQPSVKSEPPSSSKKRDSKSKKSKRRSVGFDDNVSVMSSSATYGDAPEPAVSAKQGRKGGIFGLFGKAAEESSNTIGAQQTPVEASLEDFEEPRESRKKSKGRKSSRDDEDTSAAVAESAVSSKPEAQDDWSATKKSKRGKEKRRSSEGNSAQDTGRITQDLPAQVTPPASPGHSPFLSSDDMLTHPEDRDGEHPISNLASNEIAGPLHTHDDQQPSFLGERPKQPPLPDIPDASEDPGGQLTQNLATRSEQALQALEGRQNFSSTSPEEPKRPLADLPSDSRRVSYSAPSPTAIPIREMRFGRRPSSPGLAKSLPSTPQPSATGESPFTPRRRERPHSTEFKSNEFRPMWLLEKYGSRQDDIPQETYPSLPSSHTTSRASSFHESDDFDRADAYRSAIGDIDHDQTMSGGRGLSIETSRHLNESELLDSQQTTPTAASFHSMIKESALNNQETIPSSQQPEPAANDANTTSTTVESQTEASPQDQRLLHASSARASSLHGSQTPEEGELTSTIKDVAIGGAIRGSAAFSFEPHSPHDEHSESSALNDAQEHAHDDDAAAPRPRSAATTSSRPTAEETRLLQEQDAQDAVDSWFAPAQPKKSMKDKKGKKRSKSLQDSGATLPTMPQSEKPGPLREAEEAPIIGGTDPPKPDSTPEENQLTGKPTGFIDAPKSSVQPSDDVAEPPELKRADRPSGVDVPPALLTRKDSKGKRKKSKKRGTEIWEDNDTTPLESVQSTTALVESQPDLEVSNERQVLPADHTDSANLSADAGISQDRHISGISIEEAEPAISTKKTKKGKKKNRMLLWDDAAQDESQGQSSTTEVGGVSRPGKFDAPTEQREILSTADKQLDDAEQAAPKEVPYVFPQVEETGTEAPAEPLPSDEQPNLTSDRPFDEGGRKEAKLATAEKPIADQAPWTTKPPAFDKDYSSKNVIISAEDIPLPLDDDLDLLEALPESPVIQPIDAFQPVEDYEHVLNRPDSTTEATVAATASVAKFLASENAAGRSDDLQDPIPTAIPKVVSELNLPENAIDDLAIAPTKDNDGLLVSSSSKKAKKEKKSKKSKSVQAFASGPENEAEALTPPLPTPEPMRSNVEGMDPELSRDMSQEQPEVDWPDFTTKKGKKGKMGRKSSAIDGESEPIKIGTSPPEAQALTSSPLGEANLESGSSEKPNPSIVAAPSPDQEGSNLDQFATGQEISVDAVDETAIIENEPEPISAKKKGKKGKKSKNVAFDEPTDDQLGDFVAAAAPETPAATTNTAQEIQDLLHEPGAKAIEPPIEGPEEERLDTHQPLHVDQPVESTKPLNDSTREESFMLPEESVEHQNRSPALEDVSSAVPPSDSLAPEQTPLEPATDHQARQLDRPASAEKGLSRSELPAASIGTAAEVQRILSRTSEAQDPSTLNDDDVLNPEQKDETDDFAWAPSKKKKKGKKSKPLEDVALIEQPREGSPPQVSSRIEPRSLADVPTSKVDDELPLEPSKKDKKKKRKSLSRAASDSRQEDVTTAAESTGTGEMAMTSAAPSIMEKASGLPAIEMPMSPEVAGSADPFLDIREQTSDPRFKAAFDSELKEIPVSSDWTFPRVEPHEMEMAIDAPSISEKHNQPPTVGQPPPPETAHDVVPSIRSEDLALVSPASHGSADPAALREDFKGSTDASMPGAWSSSEMEAKDTPNASAVLLPQEEDSVPGSDMNNGMGNYQEQVEGQPQSPANAIEESVPNPTSREEFEQHPESRDIIPTPKDESDAELATVALTKTKKDKKKSKKAKALDWTDAAPENLVAETLPAEETGPEGIPQSEDLTGQAEGSTTDPLAEALPLSKKDRKKSKKARAAAWEDDTPALSAERAMEPQRDEESITEPVFEEGDRAMTAKFDEKTAEPRSKSKKDKKKAKKAEAFADEEILPREAIEGEQGIIERVKEPAAASSTLDDLLVMEDLPKSKKDKKKGKKSKFVAWDDEPPAPPAEEEADQPNPIPFEPGTAVESLDRSQETDMNETLILDEQSVSKKGRKKSKKSKFVGWDEGPSISSPVDELAQYTGSAEPDTVASISEAPSDRDGSDAQQAAENTMSLPKDEAMDESADRQPRSPPPPTPTMPLALAEEASHTDRLPASSVDPRTISTDLPSSLDESGYDSRAFGRVPTTVDNEMTVSKNDGEILTPITENEGKSQLDPLGSSFEQEEPQEIVLDPPSRPKDVFTDTASAFTPQQAHKAAEESISTPPETYEDAASSFTMDPSRAIAEQPATNVLESTYHPAPEPQDFVHQPADMVSEQPQPFEQQSAIPEASAVDLNEDFASVGKKNKKKPKRSRSALAEDEDDTAAMQDTEQIPQETPEDLDVSMEQSSLSLAPAADSVEKNIKPKSKKDRMKAKKGKGVSFDDEPSVITAPLAAGFQSEELSRATDEPPASASASASVAELPEELSFASKKDRKKAKKNKTLSFDDEPSENTPQAEPDAPTESMERIPEDQSGSLDDSPALSKKDKKKARKLKKAVTWEDEDPEVTTIAEESERVAQPEEQLSTVPLVQVPAELEKLKSLEQTDATEPSLKDAAGFLLAGEQRNQPSLSTAKDTVPYSTEERDFDPEDYQILPPSTKKSKKDKKKAKKERVLSWADDEVAPEVAGSSEQDRAVTEDPAAFAAPTTLNIITESSDAEVRNRDQASAAAESSVEMKPEFTIPENKFRRSASPSYEPEVSEPSVLMDEPEKETRINPPVSDTISQIAPGDTDNGYSRRGDSNEKPGTERQAFVEEPYQSPLVEPTILSSIPEQELAPRHQDPVRNPAPESGNLSASTASKVDLEPSIQPTRSPSPQHREFDDTTPRYDESTPGISDQQLPEKSSINISQETTEQDDGFSSFAPTKKSKKSKTAKKQQIDWEDEVTSTPICAEKSSKAADDSIAPVRPEMSAWPTEVRLNQTVATQPFEQQPDPSALTANMGPSIGEFTQPAAILEERSDYFGQPPSRDIFCPPQPFDYEGHSKTIAPAPQAESRVMQTTDNERPQDEQASTVPEQPRDETATADPADTFEGFTLTKKDKKKRKQKKQMVDDVMWEFPAMNSPVVPEEAERTATLSDLTGSETILANKLPEATSTVPTPDHQKLQDETVVPEATSTTKAVDDDFSTAAKKGKKGKNSKRNKASEDAEGYTEPAEESSALDQTGAAGNTGSYQEDLSHALSQESRSSDPARYQNLEGEDSAIPHIKSREAIAAAVAVGAGLVAATQLERKESKKGKRSRKSRQSSTERASQEEEPQSRAHSPVQDKSPEVQSRVPTPERRSPIQAWHQYISPSQSPKQSELYDVEQENSKNSKKSRRQSSYDSIKRRSITPERRSPVEAWHQYNSPPHSPQQDETHDHGPGQASRGPGDVRQPTGGVNRDSAVHVSDSPMISEQSPVHRTMRDSGYPETEASPIIDRAITQQDPSETPRGFSQGNELADTTQDFSRDTRADNPLNISSEDPEHFAQSQGREKKKKKRERSPSPPRRKREHRNVELPEQDRGSMHLEEPREPSPVSSTSKDRSSVLFHSSPSTREQHEHKVRAPTPEREDNSEMVNARAESLAALSGLRERDQDGQRPSLFGGPIGVSSDEMPPVTPFDQTGILGKRLKTITEYSPEESPLHKKDRDLSDIGIPDHGVKAARRSGTPQAIQKQREQSPSVKLQEGMDLERSRSRGGEHRPSSYQSNISSLVSGQPKQREYERRSLSGASNRSIESINAIIRTPPEQIRSASGMSNRSSGTPPLRRSDRSVSSDLRGANRMSEAKKRAKQPEAEEEITIAIPPSTNTDDSAKNTGKSRVREMADVFVRDNHMMHVPTSKATDNLSQEGYGDIHGSPLSPTRPPSMRRRQSMQVLELESKLDQLASENRILQDAKSRAERGLAEATQDQSHEITSYRESIEARDTWLRQKDDELSQLKETLDSQYAQVAQLTELNQGLHASSREIDDHHERFGQLEEEHADTHQRWQQSTRDLDDLRSQHAQLSAGMEDIVRHEVSVAVEEKNAEIRHLRDELDVAKEQVRSLQQQIIASKRSSSGGDDSIITDRDEDYFDSQCHSLCQHVQQWVLRFSKFSDSRACYLASEIRDEKTVDRMENSILDGSDVDAYLADRIQRRDVFMSMVMTMTWEFIFTRYLFGADREQRQKLKSLEKTLTESVTNNNNSTTTSMASVHRWRATTLALLSRREAFRNQRAQDTEAVMHTIFSTLATILPPPSHLIEQIQSSLRKVLSAAVDLSLEMRTQRAEYVMLPPLQPEYDTNGDLARKIYFNASLMNERSTGEGNDNEDLEAREAVVRMVLFPLVVRKGDETLDTGGGDEVVVFPAQVLVAGKPGRAVSGGGKRSVRVESPAPTATDVDTGMGNMF